ncbi:MAG: hypothetical protein M3Y91_08505 [Actinomycetota bacterium]|nr:hypothetical protein [Actinomycetota bacterium]
MTVKVELLIAAVVLAHVGMLIVVALYYLLTQRSPTIKHFWDHTLVTNGDLRHSIRDVGEGILGGFLAQAIVWNHFAKSHLKAGRTFDRLHDRLHIPEVPTALLASAVFGAVGFLALYYGLHALHAHAATYTSHGSLWNRTQNIWQSSWDKKAMGYAAAFVARRPLNVIFDNLQNWFAERRVKLHKGTRFYQPPTFKARVNEIAKIALDANREVPPQGPLQSTLMLGSLVGGLALAGYGYYVLTYVA